MAASGAVERVRLRATSDAALWDRLVASSPGRSGYHTWDWLDLQERVLGLHFDRLVAHVDGQPVGVLPVPRRSAPAAGSPRLPYPYGGPLVPPELLVDTLRAFRRWQLRSGLLVGRLELGPLLTETAEPRLRAAGIESRESSTVMVDVSHGSVEEMFARFTKDRRRNVRRAVRDGASVRDARPGELAALLPQVLDEAYGGRDVPNPYPAHTGRLVEEWARGREDVAIFTALVDDEPAGVQVALGGHSTAIAWVGASLRRFRHVNVNALLYQQVMIWAIEQGCERADYCSAVDSKILHYKLAFGGVETPYLLVDSTLVPERLQRLARRLRRG